MNTSWAYFVRGNWIAAWNSNAGGTLLAGAAVAWAGYLAICAVAGRWVFAAPSDWSLLFFFTVILFATAIDWLVRILPDQGR